MSSPADLRPAREPEDRVVIARQDPPDPRLNRELYVSIGKAWQWVDRLTWTEDQWSRYANAPNLETWIMWAGDDPVGYFELSSAPDQSIEIAYFGLKPEHIGRGLGGHLLTAAVRRAWDAGASRVWLHTSTRDHPKALANYQARGFRIFKVEAR